MDCWTSRVLENKGNLCRLLEDGTRFTLCFTVSPLFLESLLGPGTSTSSRSSFASGHLYDSLASSFRSPLTLQFTPRARLISLRFRLIPTDEYNQDLGRDSWVCIPKGICPDVEPFNWNTNPWQVVLHDVIKIGFFTSTRMRTTVGGVSCLAHYSGFFPNNQGQNVHFSVSRYFGKVRGSWTVSRDVPSLGVYF